MLAASTMTTGVTIVGKTVHYAAASEVQFTVAGGTLVAAKFLIFVDVVNFKLKAV